MCVCVCACICAHACLREGKSKVHLLSLCVYEFVRVVCVCVCARPRGHVKSALYLLSQYPTIIQGNRTSQQKNKHKQFSVSTCDFPQTTGYSDVHFLTAQCVCLCITKNNDTLCPIENFLIHQVLKNAFHLTARAHASTRRAKKKNTKKITCCFCLREISYSKKSTRTLPHSTRPLKHTAS